MPSNAILNALMLEAMKKESFFDYEFIFYIQKLKEKGKINQLQEKELKEFFIIKKEKENYCLTPEDFEFLTRKLFSLYEIPNTEKIYLIYEAIRSKKLDDESAKDIIKDFDLIELHNYLIINFEKTLI